MRYRNQSFADWLGVIHTLFHIASLLANVSGTAVTSVGLQSERTRAMATLELKPTHKPVHSYYAALRQFEELGVRHETAVRSAFQNLLAHCARQRDWTLVPEWEIRRPRRHPLRVDGALVDSFRLIHGYWEAKDIRDDLRREARRKFDAGYPSDNILFQTYAGHSCSRTTISLLMRISPSRRRSSTHSRFFSAIPRLRMTNGSAPSASFRSASRNWPAASLRLSSASARPTSASSAPLPTSPTSPGNPSIPTWPMPPSRRCSSSIC